LAGLKAQVFAAILGFENVSYLYMNSPTAATATLAWMEVRTLLDLSGNIPHAER